MVRGLSSATRALIASILHFLSHSISVVTKACSNLNRNTLTYFPPLLPPPPRNDRRMKFTTFFAAALSIGSVLASNVLELTPDNFDEFIGQGKPALVELYVTFVKLSFRFRVL